LESPALERAVAFAKKNGQVALWDRSPQPYAIALYDDATNRLHPLTDEDAGSVLNRDTLIRKEWNRWNAMTGNQGSLIIIEGERVKTILEAAKDEREDDGDASGLA